LLKSIDKHDGTDFVFPAERGDGYFQGTKTMWSRAIKKADLPGVTPHTLRHTMGSTAISTGEALALTGAILGHSNPRSTAIYAHVQNDPSRRAATRVTKRIAAALAGKGTVKPQKRAQVGSDTDSDLIAALTRRLAEGSPETAQFRSAIADTLSGKQAVHRSTPVSK
jgi:hypothetical protein